jgi:hypothetical protein
VSRTQTPTTSNCAASVHSSPRRLLGRNPAGKSQFLDHADRGRRNGRVWIHPRHLAVATGRDQVLSSGTMDLGKVSPRLVRYERTMDPWNWHQRNTHHLVMIDQLLESSVRGRRRDSNGNYTSRYGALDTFWSFPIACAELLHDQRYLGDFASPVEQRTLRD